MEMEKKMASLTVEELMFLDWIRNMDSEERNDLKIYMKEQISAMKERIDSTATYRICPVCRKKAHIDVNDVRIEKIQDVFTNLNPVESRFLTTGYCPECQEILFGAEPYEGDKIIYD